MNLIPPSAMPYKTPLGVTLRLRRLPERNMDDALQMADVAGFEARRRGLPGPRQAARPRPSSMPSSGGRAPARVRRDPLLAERAPPPCSWAARTRARATRPRSSRSCTSGSGLDPAKVDATSTATRTAWPSAWARWARARRSSAGTRALEGGRQGDRQGQEDRGPMLEAAEARHRSFADGKFSVVGHRPRGRARKKSRARRSSRPSCRPASSRASTRRARSSPQAGHLAQRLPRLRGGDRSRHRRRHARSLRRSSTTSAP